MPAVSPTIDHDFVRRIAAEVVARLRGGAIGPTLDDKIVTAETLKSIETGQSVSVMAKAIVTPAAKDIARERNLSIVRLSQSAEATSPTASQLAIQDHSGRDWAAAISHQLQRRGIASAELGIILTLRPSQETFEQIQSGRRAAAVNCLVDVARANHDLRPNTWVVDVERLSLIETINLIATIANQT